MDSDALLKIVSDPSFRSLFEKTPLEKISFIASCLTAAVSLAGLFFILLQLKAIKLQLKADHERSRRELAVDLTRLWTTTMRRETNAARRFVEQCTEQECKKLANFQSFSLHENDRKNEFISILKLSFPDLDVNKIFGDNDIIASEYLLHLRYLSITYLNLLETVLSAWRHGVADKTLIEEEFSYLYDPIHGQYVLKNLRAVLHDSYPAINKFVEELVKKRDTQGRSEIAIDRR